MTFISRTERSNSPQVNVDSENPAELPRGQLSPVDVTLADHKKENHCTK